MGKDYGKTPSELLKRPIGEFLYDWQCTAELRQKEFEANQVSQSGHAPPRMGYDDWKRLVEEDVEREKNLKRKDRRRHIFKSRL